MDDDSIFPYYSPVSGGGGVLNHSNIEAVLNKFFEYIDIKIFHRTNTDRRFNFNGWFMRITDISKLRKRPFAMWAYYENII